MRVREIALDRTPVPVRGDALDPVWWRGRQWAVTSRGIEALDGTYIVDAARLTLGIDNHSWPEQMADKTWVDVDEFATAWMVALVLHGAAGKVKPARLLEVFSYLPLPGEDR